MNLAIMLDELPARLTSWAEGCVGHSVCKKATPQKKPWRRRGWGLLQAFGSMRMRLSGRVVEVNSQAAILGCKWLFPKLVPWSRDVSVILKTKAFVTRVCVWVLQNIEESL